jgi:hypothetical protein
LNTVPVTLSAEDTNAMLLLAQCDTWQLNRVSPRTAPVDVIRPLVMERVLTDAEIAGITRLLRSKVCYRCRIGKGKYFFGACIADAVLPALAAAKQDK